MRILLSNDDGFGAPGLLALEAGLQGLGDLWVVAPATEQSARSHALTLHKPLRTKLHGPQRWSVSGTPADCAYLALHGLLPEAPQVVVSGINRGGNLGSDVYYSGTVAAAREASLEGIPAVAISLHLHDEDPEIHWATAQHVARKVLEQALRLDMPTGLLLNVNVPNVPLSELEGIVAARLGGRTFVNQVERRADPRGRPYWWLGGQERIVTGEPDSDVQLCGRGFATITPLLHHLTDPGWLGRLKELFP